MVQTLFYFWMLILCSIAGARPTKEMTGWYKYFSIFGCLFCARSQVLVAKYSDVNTAFRAIDKDKSGKITPKELLDAVHAAGLPLSQPDQVNRRING
jgi:hypothetical protein